jgi:hypothetical protein
MIIYYNYYLHMPTISTNLIVDDFANPSLKNTILVTEIFNKYSPCNKKFIGQTSTKKYIINKLNRAINKVKYDNATPGEVANHRMMLDIWNALLPLPDNKLNDVPEMLYEDIEAIIRFKTNDYLKKYKNRKTPNFGGNFSGTESDSDEIKPKKIAVKKKSKIVEDNSSDSESSSESEEEQVKPKKTVVRKRTIKKQNNSIKNKSADKKESQMVEDDSSNSESNSDEEVKPKKTIMTKKQTKKTFKKKEESESDSDSD